jgi:aminomethyltransferase
MGFPLNGSDLSPERTPLEAGLGAFVRLEKGPFIGSEILSSQKATGPRVKLCGLVMEGNTPPPRPHYPVLHKGEVVGETCSGSLSPSLEIGIAMAYLPTEIAFPGNHLEIDIRGRRYPAITSKRPLYQPASLSELKKA